MNADAPGRPAAPAADSAHPDVPPPAGRPVPVWTGTGRVANVLKAVVLLTSAVVFGLTLISIGGGHPGFAPPFAPMRTTPVEVLDCRTVTGIHWYGVGEWTECDVTATMPDGERITRTLGRSVVSPDSVGDTVTLWTRCDATLRWCEWYRSGDPASTGPGPFIQVVGRSVAAVCLVSAAWCLAASVVGGARVSRRFQTRRSRAGIPVAWPAPGDVRRVESPDGVTGDALVAVRFGYRHDGEAPTRPPLLSVNGVSVPLSEWAEYEIPVPSRRLFMLRAGVWRADGTTNPAGRVALRLRPGDRVELDYLAPKDFGKPGRLVGRPVRAVERSWWRLTVLLIVPAAILAVVTG
ncbi:hypothetical protein LX16_3494 [Stackebrandtia albiflava]|uniref:Uncharacterized protein n=1 Tax=Stackebrandtia albiflava TaxID=406432 RepID=A0A562V4C8_9ACTN|nr:DUF6346 domain-containing protein [Stackebrandtia albiflava]TWJ12730.1 hypothetical protein LX16_3494 [Stackebrandtia albiflava]